MSDTTESIARDRLDSQDVVITLEGFNAAVAWVMDFYPADWGGHRGIRQEESAALVSGILRAALLVQPCANSQQQG